VPQAAVPASLDQPLQAAQVSLPLGQPDCLEHRLVRQVEASLARAPPVVLGFLVLGPVEACLVAQHPQVALCSVPAAVQARAFLALQAVQGRLALGQAAAAYLAVVQQPQVAASLARQVVVLAFLALGQVAGVCLVAAQQHQAGHCSEEEAAVEVAASLAHPVVVLAFLALGPPVEGCLVPAVVVQTSSRRELL